MTEKIEKTDKKEESKIEEKKIIKNVEQKKSEETPSEESKSKSKDEEKQVLKEKKKKEKPKIKKTEAIVNIKSIPISTKYAKEICRYIKNKKIGDAIQDLESVRVKRKAIPMRGEYGHKKGKKMSGGKYPKKATEQFIIILKSLAANSVVNGLDEPIIYQAIANLAPRQMAKFGRWQRKRTHVKIVAKEKKILIKRENKK